MIFSRESNPEIRKYMHDNNLTDYKVLESLFIQNLFKTLDELSSEKSYIGKMDLIKLIV